MKTLKLSTLICSALALCIALAPIGLRADAWNKKTSLTVNETITIPGALLSPGRYVLKLFDSQSNRHIVQVFNEDETYLIATIMAIPNERARPRGKSEFGFWEMPVGTPPALRSWFYPGDNFGQEFAYPKDSAERIWLATHEVVPVLNDQDLDRFSTQPLEDEPVLMNDADQDSLSSPPPEEEPVLPDDGDHERLSSPLHVE